MRRLLLLLTLTGCMVGPDYKKPDDCMPVNFTEACTEQSSEEDLCGWWKQLNDPFLDSLLAQAMECNYDIRIAFEKIQQARAQYRIERSYLFPEIDLTATAVRSRNSQNFFATTSGVSNIPTYENFFQLGFDAIWELDIWGKFRRGKRAAYFQWEATIDDFKNVMITMLSEVARNYVTVCTLQQKISLTLEKIEADLQELALTQDLFTAGLASEINLDSLIATIENDKAAIPVLYTSLKQTIYAIAVLVGEQPEKLVCKFNEKRDIPSGTGKVPAGLPSDLLRRRPDIRSAERQLAAQTELIGYAVADLFPHITLTGATVAGGTLAGSAIGYESNQLKNLIAPLSSFFSIGPALRWDLIDFGKVRGNIGVQTSLQKQALLSYEQTIIHALQDVEGALVAYFQEQKRWEDYYKAALSNARALELTEDLFSAGLSSEIDVLNALKTLIDAENTLADSEMALTTNLISLYKAIGGDWQCCYTP